MPALLASIVGCLGCGKSASAELPQRRELARSLAPPTDGSKDVKRELLVQRDLPDLPGWESRLYLIEFPPGAESPLHEHPVLGVGYVLEGSFESAFGDAPPTVTRAGQSFVDVPHVPHRFRNLDPARRLAFVLAGTFPKGEPLFRPVPPAHAAEVEGKQLAPGALVPEVPLILGDGFPLSLRQLKGKVSAVYFCADLAEPACAREAGALRDRWPDLQARQHLAIVGISPQDAATQRRILEEQRLPFDVSSDVDGRIASAYGVPVNGRSSPRVFLIGKDNRIRAAWRGADPEAHIEAMLAAAEEESLPAK